MTCIRNQKNTHTHTKKELLSCSHLSIAPPVFDSGRRDSLVCFGKHSWHIVDIMCTMLLVRIHELIPTDGQGQWSKVSALCSIIVLIWLFPCNVNNLELTKIMLNYLCMYVCLYAYVYICMYVCVYRNRWDVENVNTHFVVHNKMQRLHVRAVNQQIDRFVSLLLVYLCYCYCHCLRFRFVLIGGGATASYCIVRNHPLCAPSYFGVPSEMWQFSLKCFVSVWFKEWID